VVSAGAKGLLLLLEAGIDNGKTTPGSVELSIIEGNAIILTVDQRGRRELFNLWRPGSPKKFMKISKNQLNTS
jgi:hypothetical protein